MPEAAAQPSRQVREPSFRADTETSASVLAYINGFSQGVVLHAIAMAHALNSKITLLKGLEQLDNATRPIDPVVWRIRRQVAQELLRRTAKSSIPVDVTLEVDLIEGQPAVQLSKWVRDHNVELTVLGIRGSATQDREGIDVAFQFLEQGSGNILLVPANISAKKASYRRIVVSLDGSSRAESVLPFALRIAKGTGAEMILAHVAHVPELIRAGPLETEDHELREKVASRNERVAREYLEHIRHQIMHYGLTTRAVIVRDSDPRGVLANIARNEKADLIVMSSHGNSGRSDCSCGSVANYMINHASTPLLLACRPPFGQSDRDLANGAHR